MPQKEEYRTGPRSAAPIHPIPGSPLRTSPGRSHLVVAIIPDADNEINRRTGPKLHPKNP